MRKLASIQRISAIRPIPGADRIVVADVLGWSVVVGKDEFKAGDLAVYFEIDSWCDASIPAFQSEVFTPRYTNWNGKRGMRLKSIRLRKQLSQGLLMPLTAFFGPQDILEEGQDVTENLKIEKWEPAEEAKSNGPNKVAGGGAFPSFIRKTDQERVQNYITELPKHAHETFEVTIKLDGSSMTIYALPSFSPVYAHAMADIEARILRGKGFFGKLWHRLGRWTGLNPAPDVLTGVCSRNIELPIAEGNAFSNYVRRYSLLEALENYCVENGMALAIQGELIAPTIQGNFEQVTDFQYHVYDIFDITAQAYLKPADVRFIIDEINAEGLNLVPLLIKDFKMAPLAVYETPATGTSRRMVVLPDSDDPRKMVDAILDLAEGPGMNEGVLREGLVFKSNETDFSFKAISTSYLLAKG